MDQNNTKLSHKKWKAQIKKQKRKIKRQMLAESHKDDVVPEENNESCEETEILSDEEEKRKQNLQWLEREKEAQEIFKAKKEKEEKDRIQKENEKKRIREQFEEEKQMLDPPTADEVNKVITEKLEDSSANSKDFKGPPTVWHNPEAPDGYDQEANIKNICPFFQKVGVCRYGMSCSRVHPPPGLSAIIMFPGMFTSFGMEHIIHDALGSDVNLEYDDQDTYEDFDKFYEETYPEFRKAGKIRNFLVCSNHEPHLKGNVYVEFSRKSEAERAFRMFNGRWFDKRQLSCQFVQISNWATAICGLFYKNKCPKGKHCNFLHVFRCPRDMETKERVPDRRERSSHRSHRDKSRSPSKSRARSKKSRSRSSHRTRSRSRSTHASSRKTRTRNRSPHKSRSRSRSSRRSESKRSTCKSGSRNGLSPNSRCSSRSTSRNKSSRRSRSKSNSRHISIWTEFVRKV